MAKKKAPVNVPQPVIEKTVVVTLDDAGRTAALRRIAGILTELDVHDAAASKQRSEIREERAEIMTRLRRARDAAETGEEEREVSVIVRPKMSTWEIEYADAVTGEVYENETRDMTAEERAKYAQQPLDMAGS